MNIHLLIDYFKHPNSGRAEELDFCFLESINSKELDFIHVFAQSELPVDNTSDNITINRINNRLTYQYYIDYAKNNIPVGDIVVLSNSDIFFDETILKVKEISLDNIILALTRFCPHHGHWVDEKGIVIPYHNHHRSQDVWIWKNKLNQTKGDYNFELGTLGCDNKIAYEFHKDNYKVWNPSFSIICYHKHSIRIEETPEHLKVWHSRPYLLPNACFLENINNKNYQYYITIE
jgi:hypothetical protein